MLFATGNLYFYRVKVGPVRLEIYRNFFGRIMSSCQRLLAVGYDVPIFRVFTVRGYLKSYQETILLIVLESNSNRYFLVVIALAVWTASPMAVVNFKMD